MKDKQKKITNRARLIQALKENNLDDLEVVISCDCCGYSTALGGCSSYECDCRKGIELWLDQEVSDE